MIAANPSTRNPDQPVTLPPTVTLPPAFQAQPNYVAALDRVLRPLLDTIVARRSLQRGVIIGISGAQGSGKSTLARCLAAMLGQLGYTSVVASLDDFYLTRADRQELASQVHPLLGRRGVPGTHDLPLAIDTLTRLRARPFHVPVQVARFDKATDDRRSRDQWTTVSEAPDFILFEGWCIGAIAQSEPDLTQPVNDLEARQDADGHWRRFVNQQLTDTYPALWSLLDYLAYLNVPDLDAVYRWRTEQESQLQPGIGPRNAIMSPEQVRAFIALFERLTLAMQRTLPSRADCCIELNAHHAFTRISFRQ